MAFGETLEIFASYSLADAVQVLTSIWILALVTVFAVHRAREDR